MLIKTVNSLSIYFVQGTSNLVINKLHTHATSQKFVVYTYFVVSSWVLIHGALQVYLYLSLTFPDPQLPADWETLAGNNYLLE